MGMNEMSIARATRTLACALGVAVGLVGVASAHHSFAMFDSENKIKINGTVTAFEWTNPHVYIELDVPDEQGAMKHWSIELGSPSILQRAGWKFNILKPGDRVTLLINPLRNKEPGGMLSEITFADGRVLRNGGPPPGAGAAPAAPSAPAE
jgi:hypothetical protein